MRCRRHHNYVYTQGYFYCTRCGHRRYHAHRGRRRKNKKIGIGLGIFATIAIVAFVVVNYSGNFQILSTPIEQITEYVPKPPIFKLPPLPEPFTMPAPPSRDTKTSDEPTKIYPTLTELRQIALDDINKYRIEKGLRTIVSGSAKSSQLYAEELLKEGCIHHVSDRGEGPMLRYKNNGDTMFLVAENIAGQLGTDWGSPEDQVLEGNYNMMFDDAESDWGHRDNILGSQHVSISIGIAYDSERLVMVQDFESVLPSGYQYDPSSFMTEPVDQRYCW